ncbi:hypothetical protein [Pseudomonas sp. YL-218 TE3947]|uniref:hypothetical protein n=1 Tax=Pseudomonas TaxID=286 RepID=UPI003D1B3024
MQTDNAKQGSGLKLIKTIGKWALVPGLGVPATKLAESYYDVSFFSSSMAAIGGWMLSVGTWLSQSFPMQLWVLVAVTVGMGFIAATGIWGIYEANTELKATKTELSKAYAKARDANVELNSVDAKLNAANKELSAANSKLIATRNKLDTANMELVIAQVTIADLQAPKVQPLTEHQRRALAAIAYYDNSGEKCYVVDLSERIKFTKVQADGAVDVLVKRKLVQEYYVNGYRIVSLSPDGREYVLHPDFDMSYLPL